MSKEKQMDAVDKFRNELMHTFIDLCRGNDYNKLTLLKIGDTIDRIYDKQIDDIRNDDEEDCIEVEWEWFDEWSPSTTEHPRECDDCGWRCGRCKVTLEDMVGGHWDDASEAPKLRFCPSCGAKMKGV
jgi:hypothetical protein